MKLLPTFTRPQGSRTRAYDSHTLSARTRIAPLVPALDNGQKPRVSVIERDRCELEIVECRAPFGITHDGESGLHAQIGLLHDA